MMFVGVFDGVEWLNIALERNFGECYNAGLSNAVEDVMEQIKVKQVLVEQMKVVGFPE